MEWEKIDEKLIKDGFRKVCLKTFILPNGVTQDFEIKKEREGVCILPITRNNNVVLAKQFRPGPEKVFLELPGGGMDKNETPEEAIRRELLEEVGYAGDIKFVASIPKCAWSTSTVHCFVATDCYKKEEQKLDSTEFIEVVEMPLADFREHLKSGQLIDPQVSYLGLDYLNLL